MRSLLLLCTAALLLDLAACSTAGPPPEATVATAAGPATHWARRLGGRNREYSLGLAVDEAGGAYLAGHFLGETDLDPGPRIERLRSAGGADAWVAALSATGRARWSRRFGGPGADEGRAVAARPGGEIYVTGFFSETAAFGSVELASAGSADVFVARLDTEGAVVWARALGGPLGDLGLALAADGTGVVVTGSFQGEADLDPGPGETILSSAGRRDAFIARLDPDGGLVWARRFGGPGDDEARGVALAADGSVTLAGDFTATAGFDGEGPRITSAGAADAFVARLDSTGTPRWVVSLGGEETDTAQAVAVDAAAVYVAGQFRGTMRPGSETLTADGPGDGFAARLDPAGRLIWARRLGGPGGDSLFGIAATPAGDALVAGFSQPVPGEGSGETASFLTRLDPAGEATEIGNFESERGVQALGLALSGSGTPYVTGVLGGDAVFDLGGRQVTLPEIGKIDAFVARLGIAP